MSWISSAWAFEYALLPCLTTYLVFDALAIARRLTRSVYLPIYFAFFPSSYTDDLYAQYFGDDQMWQLGGTFSPEQRRINRRKIIAVATLSLVAAAIIAPMIAGSFSYFILTGQQFIQFLWTLALIKTGLLAKSLWDLKRFWLMEGEGALKWIAMIYVGYLVTILHFTHRSYEWAVSKSPTSFLDWLGYVRTFTVEEIGAKVLLIIALGVVFSWLMTGEADIAKSADGDSA